MLLYNVDSRRAEPFSDEESVLVKCIGDVLDSTPGLRHSLFLDPQEIGSRDPTAFALFLIEHNPVLDLTVSIELVDRAVVIHVNELAFTRRRGATTRFEWWVERRCRDLERLVAGELRLVRRTIFGVPVLNGLEAGHGDRWYRIASIHNPVWEILSVMMPYGLFAGAASQRVYPGWFDTGE